MGKNGGRVLRQGGEVGTQGQRQRPLPHPVEPVRDPADYPPPLMWGGGMRGGGSPEKNNETPGSVGPTEPIPGGGSAFKCPLAHQHPHLPRELPVAVRQQIDVLDVQAEGRHPAGRFGPMCLAGCLRLGEMRVPPPPQLPNEATCCLNVGSAQTAA